MCSLIDGILVVLVQQRTVVAQAIGGQPAAGRGGRRAGDPALACDTATIHKEAGAADDAADGTLENTTLGGRWRRHGGHWDVQRLVGRLAGIKLFALAGHCR